MAPAGALWKAVRAAEADALDPRYWRFPIEPENVLPLYRRERGSALARGRTGMAIRAQAYEERLLQLLVRARKLLAAGLLRKGQYQACVSLYESVLKVDREEREDPGTFFSLGVSFRGAGLPDSAIAAFEKVLALGPEDLVGAEAHQQLGEILHEKGREGEAVRHLDRAKALREATRHSPR